MDNYNIYCIKDDITNHNIYRFIDKIPNKKINDNNLIIVCQTSNSLNEYLKYMKDFVYSILINCLEHNQYNKIILVTFNSITNFVEITKENYIKSIDLLITDDGVDYNSLNNTLIDIIIDLNKCKILLFTNGDNPYDQNINESFALLSSFTKSIDCSLKILSVTDMVNDTVINTYKTLSNNPENLKIDYVSTIHDIENIIEEIVDIRYLCINDYKIKLNLINNEYVIDLFDLVLTDNEILLKSNKIENMSLEDKLESLYNTIILCLQINDYNKLIKKNKIIKEIVKKYIKLDEYLIKKFKFGCIKNQLKDISLHLMNLSKNELLKGKFSSQLIEYFDRSTNILVSSKYKLNFNDIINKNIQELKNIDININNKFEEIQKFINKYNPVYEEKDNTVSEDNKNKFKKSIETYYSIISITDWFEELQSKGIMGLMVRIASPNIAKIGYNLNSVEIKDITTTVIPIQNMLEAANIYYEKYNKLDFGFEYESMISGNAIGNGNSILPLYICKEHWELSRLYLKPALGIMLCQNPLIYNKNHIPFVFTLFMDMVNRTFMSNKLNANKKWIQLLFGVYRTCVQISKENFYDKGIIKIYNKYMTSPLYRTKNIIKSITSFLGQILVTNLQINNLNRFSLNIFEENIRRDLYTYLLKSTTLVNFLCENDNTIEFNEFNLNDLIYKFESTGNKISETILNFCKFYTIIKKFIKKYDNFDNFINMLDKNYSILNEEDLEICQQFIINNINNEVTTLNDIYKFTKTKLDKEFYKKCVLQGLDQKNNKIRSEYIKKGYYNNLHITTYENLQNNILKKYKNNNKIITSINYLKENNICIVTENGEHIGTQIQLPEQSCFYYEAST